MGTLLRNVIVTDPDTGKRTVLRKGTAVPEKVAGQVDPAAYGATAPADAVVEQTIVHVDGVPLEALVGYAHTRGIDCTVDTPWDQVLEALADQDEEIRTALAAAEQDEANDQAEAEAAAATAAAHAAADAYKARIAKLLEEGVDEVNAHLDEYPEDIPAVLAAEGEAKKPRVGITEGRHAPDKQ